MPENITNKRKTFAIISHPDAGKTTLTEKLLLFGGAIQQAGAVKARGENRRAHSDWMKVEQERNTSFGQRIHFSQKLLPAGKLKFATGATPRINVGHDLVIRMTELKIHRILALNGKDGT